MALANNPVSLAPGCPVKLTNKGSITGPCTLQFTVPTRPGGGDFSGFFMALGTLTGLAAALQVDISSGALASNPVSFISSFLSAATPQLVGPGSSTLNPLIVGATYIINVTALTSGPCDVYAVIN